jgi:hypothetical protein
VRDDTLEAQGDPLPGQRLFDRDMAAAERDQPAGVDDAIDSNDGSGGGAAGGGARHGWWTGRDRSRGAQAGQVSGGQPGRDGFEVRAGDAVAGQVDGGGVRVSLGLSQRDRDYAPMSEPTHATVATFRLDMSREEEQRRGLREFLVPRISQRAGFLNGYWMLDREVGLSVVVIIFSSREDAEALRENVEGSVANQAAAAIELVRIRVLEITASA